VTIEFALALILLVGAGLLIRSFGKLLRTNPGFRPDHVLALNVPLPRQTYPEAAQIQGFYKQLLDRVSNSPGVQAAGLSSDLPLGAREKISITIEGRGQADGAGDMPVLARGKLLSSNEHSAAPGQVVCAGRPPRI
jgi:putative ABC transport system permease protein